MAIVCMQHHGIFKRKQRSSVDKQTRTCQFTVPEVKICFVLLYWLMLTIMIWTSLSIRIGRVDTADELLRSYTNCMAGGDRKGHNCHSLRTDLEAEESPAAELLYLFLAAFLNFATLPFVIQFQTVQQSVKQASRKLSIRQANDDCITI